MTEENRQQIETTDQEIITPITTHRVKFYQLNSDTHWEDKGTGHCVYQEVLFFLRYIKTRPQIKFFLLLLLTGRRRKSRSDYCSF